MSKEFVRQYYIKIGFKDKLNMARNKGVKIPKIHALPEKIIKKTSKLYIDMLKRLTNIKHYE